MTQKINKIKKLGLQHKIIDVSHYTKTQFSETLSAIKNFNNDTDVSGICIELPLSVHLKNNYYDIVNEITPSKDVEALNTKNYIKIFSDEFSFENILKTHYPTTALACVLTLKYYNVDLKGKKAVIVGRSNIVGYPIAIALEKLGSTVTICNSYTKDLENYVRQADILVSATGHINIIKGEWVKKDSVCIDVGITQKVNETGKIDLFGDIDYVNAIKNARLITPVPGGIGPVTVAAMMQNLVN